MSGLGDSCIDGDDSCVLSMLIIYYIMLYIIYVTLIMRLWDIYILVAILVEFDMDSLLLFPPHFRRCFRLVINQLFGSCRVKLIPKVWSCLSAICYQRLSLLYWVCYIFMHCLLILPLICSYMWELPSKTHIWCISGFALTIGYYMLLLIILLNGLKLFLWIR